MKTVELLRGENL